MRSSRARGLLRDRPIEGISLPGAVSLCLSIADRRSKRYKPWYCPPVQMNALNPSHCARWLSRFVKALFFSPAFSTKPGLL